MLYGQGDTAQTKKGQPKISWEKRASCIEANVFFKQNINKQITKRWRKVWEVGQNTLTGCVWSHVARIKRVTRSSFTFLYIIPDEKTKQKQNVKTELLTDVWMGGSDWDTLCQVKLRFIHLIGKNKTRKQSFNWPIKCIFEQLKFCNLKMGGKEESFPQGQTFWTTATQLFCYSLGNRER